MTLRGRLERVQVGMGAWLLVDAGGRRYELLGDLPLAWSGRDVVVEGTPFEGMTTGMLGADPVRVVRAQIAP